MLCEKCNQDIPDNSSFCLHCGTKQTKAVANKYKSPYGNWEVSTEADCEGRTIKKLGTHTGYIDEIAKYLAPQVCYSLRFTAIKLYEKEKPRKNVNVSLDIDSKTWDMSSTERAIHMKEVFRDRPVEISECSYYAAFTINFK